MVMCHFHQEWCHDEMFAYSVTRSPFPWHGPLLNGFEYSLNIIWSPFPWHCMALSSMGLHIPSSLRAICPCDGHPVQTLSTPFSICFIAVQQYLGWEADDQNRNIYNRDRLVSRLLTIFNQPPFAPIHIHIPPCKAPFNGLVMFLPDPGVSGVRSMGPGVSIYVTPSGTLWNFADVTLADDINSIRLMIPI